MCTEGNFCDLRAAVEATMPRFWRMMNNWLEAASHGQAAAKRKHTSGGRGAASRRSSWSLRWQVPVAAFAAALCGA